MSSGKRGWCISVRMSPGSSHQTLIPTSHGEDVTQLLERGFARAVRTPAFVALDGRVGGDVQDRAVLLLEQGKRKLNEGERGEQVGFLHLEQRRRREVRRRGVGSVRGCSRVHEQGKAAKARRVRDEGLDVRGSSRASA